MVLADTILLFLGLIVMYVSSGYVVKGAITISKSFGIKAFATGFIFVSLATASPEMFITILSLIRGEAGLAVGNIFGSNLANLSVILGLVIVIGGTVYLTRKEVIDLVELTFIATMIPLILIQKGTLATVSGFILLSLFIFYIYKVKRDNKIMEEVGHESFIQRLRGIFTLLVAMAFLLVGSEFIVRSSLNLAGDLALSTTLIGITIVAVGTSLPELFVGIRSVRNKEYGLALGNLFGSGIVDLTLLLGIVGIFSNAPVDVGVIATSMPYLIIVTMGIWYMLVKKEELKLWVGLVLILLYAAFVLQELGIL